MRARDIMTTALHTVRRDTPVGEVVGLLLDRRISGVPVVEGERVIGIISEGDLILRERAQRPRGGMAFLAQQLFEDHDKLAREYRKAHGLLAEDVMTRDVITVRPGTPVAEVAHVMAERQVKRLPVVEDDRLVGIVTRADILKAVAQRETAADGEPAHRSDAAITDALIASLRQEPWAEVEQLTVSCSDGHVTLQGAVESVAEREAVEVAARAITGVREVSNQLLIQPGLDLDAG